MEVVHDSDKLFYEEFRSSVVKADTLEYRNVSFHNTVSIFYIFFLSPVKYFWSWFILFFFNFSTSDDSFWKKKKKPKYIVLPLVSQHFVLLPRYRTHNHSEVHLFRRYK